MTALVDRARAWAAIREHQRATRPPRDDADLVDRLLVTACGVLAIAGLIVSSMLTWVDPNPVIGTVTAVHRGPDVVTWHDDPPVDPWTSTKPGVADVTVVGDRGAWTVAMAKPEAVDCFAGSPYRLHTGCDSSWERP